MNQDFQKTKVTKITLNQRVSDYFELPYSNNEGMTTTIHTSALDRVEDLVSGGWDDHHLEIIDLDMELELEGVGFGKWKILNM